MKKKALVRRAPRPASPFAPKRGSTVVWNGRLARIEAIVSPAEILVGVLGTGESACTRLEELGPPAPIVSCPQVRADEDPELEARAREWCQRLRQLANGQLTAEQVGEYLGVSLRSVQRHQALYLENPTPGAQLAGIPGPAPGARRLHPSQEAIVAHVIEREFLRLERPPISAVMRRVEEDCKAAGIEAPGYKAVRARVRACEPLRAAKRRLGPHEGEATQAPSVRGLRTSRALQVVQIDHALVDLILVTADTRQVIGRPWITLAIDVHTRCVLGYHLGFEDPNQTSVGLCLEHACLPKGPWLHRLDVDVDYPMCGRMESVSWDNAKTFQATEVRRQCELYGIIVLTRPVRKPHYGAYIERYIGTFMGKVHLLPGTTFSNSQDRGDYASERHAVMSFSEFAKWVALEIAGVYHNTPHRGLQGLTPKQAWTRAWTTQGGQCQLPPLIADAREFVVGFLPAESRKVCRQGIALKGLRYWDPALTPLINNGRAYRVHYHQGDLSKVFLHIDGHYIDVPLLDRAQPPFTLYELREARRALKQQGLQNRDEKGLFAAIAGQRQLQDGAAATSKSARRKQARRAPVSSDVVANVDFSIAPRPVDTAWEDTL